MSNVGCNLFSINMRRFFTFSFLFLAFSVASASAAPIYVFKEPDGSIRFTSKAPAAGVTYKVFTSSKPNFSVYKSGSYAVGIRGAYNISRARLRSEYNDIIQKAAMENQLEASLIKAVIHVESAFNSRAVSPKGARGLMQLMPGTAKDYGVRNSFTPKENIHAGARHLARLLNKFKGNMRLALAAYNAGEVAVEKYNGIPPYNETQMYVRRVLALKERYRASV